MSVVHHSPDAATVQLGQGVFPGARLAMAVVMLPHYCIGDPRRGQCKQTSSHKPLSVPHVLCVTCGIAEAPTNGKLVAVHVPCDGCQQPIKWPHPPALLPVSACASVGAALHAPPPPP